MNDNIKCEYYKLPTSGEVATKVDGATVFSILDDAQSAINQVTLVNYIIL